MDHYLTHKGILSSCIFKCSVNSEQCFRNYFPFVFYRSSLPLAVFPPEPIQTPRGVALQLLSAH